MMFTYCILTGQTVLIHHFAKVHQERFVMHATLRVNGVQEYTMTDESIDRDRETDTQLLHRCRVEREAKLVKRTKD